MAIRNKNKNTNEKSLVAANEAKQNEMTKPREYDMFLLAAVALFTGVLVAPLTAEMSACKYTRQLRKTI